MIVAAGIITLLTAIFGSVFFFEKRKQRRSKKEKPDIPSAQTFLKIKDIRHSAINLGAGEYRAAIECGSINYFLLSDNEQSSVESAFSRYLSGLTRPVQFQIQTRQVDMRWAINQIRSNAARQQNPVLQGYAENLAG
ncbi:hypothetical protein GTO91_13765, partial [Heliobacterium undosum]